MAITRDLWIILRARDEASRIIRSFSNNVSGAAASAATNMSAFDRNMQRVALTMQQFAMTSMLAGTAMAGMGVAALHFLKGATDVAVAYEKQVRATKTQVDDISISLEDLAAVGRRVAREVEVPFEQMQETLFLIFSSMNVTLAESEQLLKGFAKEAVAGQTSVETAARSNIAILNALGLTTKDLGRIQDVQFQVVRKGVITYEELSNVIGRALPAAARSGQSIETLGAMLAFLTRNGLSAAMASASAARALESFAHPTTVKRLEEIGIKVRDAKGEFLPLLQVMTQMNTKLKDMAQPERAAFFQELFKGAGGTIQARRFWDTAFKNFGDFEEMMGFMTNSAGVFENSYATMANSVAAKSVLLANKWMLIKEALGRAVMPHLIKLMTLLGQVLDWFDRLPEPTKNMIAQFLLWGSVISIVVGVLVILIGVLAFFISGIIMAGTALVNILVAIAAVTAIIIALGAALYLAWQRSENFRVLLRKITDIAKEVWKSIETFAQGVKQAFDTEVRPALEKLMTTFETKVLPGVLKFAEVWKEEVLPKIQEATRFISHIVHAVFIMVSDVLNNIVIPAIERLSEWWKRNSDNIRPFLEIGAQVVKWLLILGAALILAPLTAFVAGLAAVIIAVENFILALKFLWSWIVIAFNFVKDYFVALFGFAHSMGEKVFNIFITAWQKLTGAVKDGVTRAENFISGFKNTIITIFNNAKDWLINAGKNIIDGLIDGVNKGIEKLKNVLKNITDLIPKIKGPKSVDLKLLVPVGKNIMQGFMNGIESQIPMIRAQLQGLTTQVGQLTSPNFTVPTPSFAAGAPTEERNITQYITVNTQEINPRVHAEELGFELGNRL